MFFILYPDNLEEGRIVRITSPNFPNDYPLGHKEEWRLLSATGYVLNFTNFSLEYNYDFLHIHNGENATDIDSKKKLSGSFDNSFAYVYNGSFLHLTFTSDDYIVSSGFSVDIVAKNISTLGEDHLLNIVQTCLTLIPLTIKEILKNFNC